jgi:hypothetical protein
MNAQSYIDRGPLEARGPVLAGAPQGGACWNRDYELIVKAALRE